MEQGIPDKFASLGLTYDDVLLLPGETDVVPSEVDTTTRLTRDLTLSIPLLSADGWWWLLIKVFFFASCFIWFRASFPRYRYDQIMRLGWKVFILLTLAWIAVIGLWMQTPWSLWR